MNSTTVTFEPSASYTVAISRPMMPPPMISRRLGTSSSSSAPVESMRRGSSYGKPGMRADCEPAAMMQLSNETTFLPSLRLDLERLRRGELRLALDHRHLARLGEPGEALGELADHAVLELAHAVELDLRLRRR